MTTIHTLPSDYTPASQCLAGKTLLVTGAGDGIGRAAALSYARMGATVLLLGKTLSKLEAVYDEIEALGAPTPAILPVNLNTATENDYNELANLINTEFGRLDGILHNAAQLGVTTPLAQYDCDMWNSVIQTNLTAPVWLTQSLLPILVQSPHASVVFLSSSVGRQVRPFWGAYAISKMALEGASQLFDGEFKNTHNLRFNCLNPGATRTNMRAQAYPGEDPYTLPEPMDIMPLFVYLMDDASIGVSGNSFDAQPK